MSGKEQSVHWDISSSCLFIYVRGINKILNKPSLTLNTTSALLCFEFQIKCYWRHHDLEIREVFLIMAHKTTPVG